MIYSRVYTRVRVGRFDPVIHIQCVVWTLLLFICFFLSWFKYIIFYIDTICWWFVSTRPNFHPLMSTFFPTESPKSSPVVAVEPRRKAESSSSDPRTSPSSEHRPVLLCPPLCTFLCFSTVPSQTTASWDTPSVRERERLRAQVRRFEHDNVDDRWPVNASIRHSKKRSLT